VSSIRERIVLAVLARVGEAIAPVPVLRQPTVPLTREESPALLLVIEGDAITRKANLAADRVLQLRLVAIARGAAAFAQTDQIIVAAHAALLSEPSLGGLAIGIDETDLEWDAEDADAGAVALPVRFEIRYRTATHDLTQNG
jgi:hypothetical protein